MFGDFLQKGRGNAGLPFYFYIGGVPQSVQHPLKPLLGPEYTPGSRAVRRDVCRAPQAAAVYPGERRHHTLYPKEQATKKVSRLWPYAHPHKSVGFKLPLLDTKERDHPHN